MRPLDPHIFREYDIRGIVGEQLDDAVVRRLGQAFATYFARNGVRRVAVGYDARESSPVFAEIVGTAVTGSGIDVLDIGRVPTPVLYHTVHTQDVGGGIMITGSHNPADHNGFKICLGTAAIFGDSIREIGQLVEEGSTTRGSGTLEKADLLPMYLRDVRSRLSLGPRKLTAVVDAGNGMGGVTAVPLYRDLGVNVIELFTEPDAAFPNHHPDPTVEANLQDLIAEVRRSGADVGIAFDGDGDRIGVVDETGRIIWGDELMILFARAVLEERPESVVIAEVKCSQNLFDEIERAGGRAEMWKAGHSLIKARMKETASPLAGEMSGHIFFADRYYGYDDATYAGARLLEILSRTEQPVSALLADVPRKPSTPELRVPCPDSRKFAVVERIAQHFSATNEVNTIDGARIRFDNGWGLVRASNTQAILVLRFEADTEAALAEIRSLVEGEVEKLL